MPLLLFIIAAVMIIPMIGCSDDDDKNNNPEFVEYINPMVNNPVNTIDWLMKKKEEMKLSLDKNGYTEWQKNEQINEGKYDIIAGARIKLYAYNGQDYYEIIFGGLDLKEKLKIAIFPYNCDVYNSQGKLCVSIIGGDAVGTQPGYEHFSNFWETATFKSLLWEYKTNN